MNGLFPLYQKGAFEYPVAMALATLLGLGFGFALERGGFGSARRLAAQFYGTDMRVLKVMFSAIVTATVGLGIFGGLGVVDLGALQIPGTWWWPQIVGGFVLGAGFIVSGYCPGTAVVATASGNLDGIVSLVGVMFGALLFGALWPALEGFYQSGEAGVVTLNGMLGVPWAVVAAGVVAMAVGAFLFGEWVERLLAKKGGTEAPDVDPRTRNRVFAGFGVAAALGLAALAVSPAAIAPPAPSPVAQWDAETLADALVRDPGGVYLVDLRDAAACGADRIAGALCLPEGEEPGAFFATLPATRTLVVYGDADLADAPADARRFTGKVAVLKGGHAAFRADILTPPPAPTEATPRTLADFERKQALYAWFTGAEAAPPPVMPTRKVITRKTKKGGGC